MRRDTTKQKMDVSNVKKTPSVIGKQILVQNVLMVKYPMQDLHLSQIAQVKHFELTFEDELHW